MTDKDNTPKFSEQAIDDLVASHGRKPSDEQKGMIENMIDAERMKMHIREKMRVDRTKRREQRFERGR